MAVKLDHSNYHNISTNPKMLKKTVTRIAKKLKKLRKNNHFDAIAFCGSSGAAVAYPVSVMTGIPVINIRRKNEHCNGFPIEGPAKKINSFIIVDDFICSGYTVRWILNTLITKGLTCKKICLYRGTYFSRRGYYYSPKALFIPTCKI